MARISVQFHGTQGIHKTIGDKQKTRNDLQAQHSHETTQN